MLLTAGVISFIVALAGTPLCIKLFTRLELGQFVREDGPHSHLHLVKRGTPTMGGIVFLLAAVVGLFGAALLTDSTIPVSVYLVLLMAFGMAAIGFLDDFLKAKRHNSDGLSGWGKIVGQVVVATLFAVLAINSRDAHHTPAATQSISFVYDLSWANLAVWGGVPIVGLLLYLIWVNVLSIATTNGVNLTDGMDGLAAGSSIITLTAYVLIGFWQFRQSCFGEHSLAHEATTCYTAQSPLALAAVAAALCGGIIGFLWWNTHPARIFMGDVGALGIGGAITALAVLTRTELLLLLLGGLFVIEVGSVIMQRTYFKLTRGKRIIRSSPLHHHFELKGWSEVTIVARFWVIAGLCTALGLAIFYWSWVTG